MDIIKFIYLILVVVNICEIANDLTGDNFNKCAIDDLIVLYGDKFIYNM